MRFDIGLLVGTKEDEAAVPICIPSRAKRERLYFSPLDHDGTDDAESCCCEATHSGQGKGEGGGFWYGDGGGVTAPGPVIEFVNVPESLLLNPNLELKIRSVVLM